MQFSLLYRLSLHNVAFSFTWSSDFSEAYAGVGHKASDNFIEYWTQAVSDKQINVYTMRAAAVTTLFKTGCVCLQMHYKYFACIISLTNDKMKITLL